MAPRRLEVLWSSIGIGMLGSGVLRYRILHEVQGHDIPLSYSAVCPALHRGASSIQQGGRVIDTLLQYGTDWRRTCETND